MTRNIKNGLFGWYEKGAMKLIEDHLSSRKAASSKLVYIALCSIAAKNGNTSTIQAYQYEIARYSSVSDRTVREALKELNRLKIIKYNDQERSKTGKFEKVKLLLLNTNFPPSEFTEEKVPTAPLKTLSPSKKTKSTPSDGSDKALATTQPASEPAVGTIFRTESSASNFPMYIDKERKKEDNIITNTNIYARLAKITKGEKVPEEEMLAFKFYVAAGEKYLAMYGKRSKKNEAQIFEEWINDFEKIMRLDGFEFQYVDTVLDWLYRLEKFSDENLPLPNSDWWRPQINTPAKFRTRQKKTKLLYTGVLIDKCRQDCVSIKKELKSNETAQKKKMQF